MTAETTNHQPHDDDDDDDDYSCCFDDTRRHQSSATSKKQQQEQTTTDNDDDNDEDTQRRLLYRPCHLNLYLQVLFCGLVECLLGQYRVISNEGNITGRDVPPPYFFRTTQPTNNVEKSSQEVERVVWRIGVVGPPSSTPSDRQARRRRSAAVS